MKYDHFSMLPERAFQPRNGRTGMTLEGGGGGGGHTTSTVTQQSIPDWLRPQTEALLGAGMQEYFQTEFNPATGGYDIVGTKPYTPYSSDPRDYVAQFSPQQQQVFRETAGMRTPGGFATGQQMTGVAGQGGLETVGGAYGYGGQGALFGQEAASMAPMAQQFGFQGANIGAQGLMAQPLGADIGQEARFYGQQAAGMGGLYEQMATDPMSVQAYMSPYMQQVVEIQKQQAIEDAQRAQLGANLGAARQGTYGGARQTLAQAQREAGLTKQLSDIQARGLQDAFQQAQQAQQFGVTTGLQGLQGAQQGLGTAIQGGQLGLSGIDRALAGQQAGLAGLGEARALYGLGLQGAQTGLQGVQAAQAGYGLTGQMGAQAANIANQQQAADLARLGFQGQMGDIQQQQQQRIIDQAIQNFALAEEMPMQRLAGYNALLRGYATPTSTVSQYQAGPNALQSIGALGTAAGGIGSLVSGKKEGGVIKYAGGGITDINALEGMAQDLSIPQIQQSMKNETLPKYVGMPILEQKINEAERMKMAQSMMGQQQGQQQSISDALMAKANQLQGIGDVVSAAGGGIVAFEAGGLVTPRQLQEVMNRVNSATNPAQKQAAQAEYDSLLAAYRMQQSASSDTGAGIGIEPMGGIMPAPTPNVKSSQGVTAKPPTPEPQQGITEVVPPELTREQEVDEYLKDRAKLVGESSLAKFYADQAAEERPFFDRLSSASARLAIAGNILADPSRSAEYAMQADALGRAEAERIYKQKEAAAKAEEVAREEKGKGFDVVEGRREERAKEKRAEARKKAEMEAEQKFKREITQMELKARADIADKSTSSQVEYIGKLLDSDDAKKRALGERLLPLIQGVTNANLTLRIQKQAMANVDADPRALALKMTKPAEYQRLVNEEAKRLQETMGINSPQLGSSSSNFEGFSNRELGS